MRQALAYRQKLGREPQLHGSLEKKLFLGAAGLGAILLVPTMAVSGMMAGLASGSPIQALGGLLAGAIAGALFAVVIGGIAAVGLGTLYRSCAGTDDQVVRYMEEVTVHASRAEALSACERAIATLDGKITPIEAAGSSHVAMLVKPGWRWYGEIVSCDVVEIAPGMQRVTVESRPHCLLLSWPGGGVSTTSGMSSAGCEPASPLTSATRNNGFQQTRRAGR